MAIMEVTVARHVLLRYQATANKGALEFDELHKVRVAADALLLYLPSGSVGWTEAREVWRDVGVRLGVLRSLSNVYILEGTIRDLRAAGADTSRRRVEGETRRKMLEARDAVDDEGVLS